MNLENKIIDCKAIAADLENKLLIDVQNLKAQGIHPTFATILVGENPASMIYVKNKQKKAAALGITNNLYHLSADTTENELLDLIISLNNNPQIHGMIVQLPLPKHIDVGKVINTISPYKDIDGLHPINIGYLATQNADGFVPCTPLGCLHIIKTVMGDITGKTAVVVGRSNLVGLPAAQLLLNNNATVSIAHSKTVNLIEVCRSADILVSAVGRANFIGGAHIKQGATVIDVGINKITVDGVAKVVGDVNMESALPVAGAITPVPKGVGLLTIMFLMSNVVKAAAQG
ncbi:MAG: bifunctional methylenetetrahydrofolate dehydrogenase/methenyltetrahydrofolate cyclohydrolase [Alphaproteobacteria bacterium]|jgi:methylenetetrahydrofolate dehydrogenase (NADP+)/methenyltetrahydrofolate cyclohydrolase|nr:bifunctional methylenetetrahydrofolate dehydrogenase/methenyltetrahydrofolate cyclohydrolase [Alphaproteobacteria bacterium]